MIDAAVLAISRLKERNLIGVDRHVGLDKRCSRLSRNCLSKLAVQISKNNIGSVLAGETDKPFANSTGAAYSP